MIGKNSWRVALFAAAAVAPMLSGVAQAQESSAASASEGAALVGEVVVTAQRRSQNLQTVPLSVTAANAEQLAAKRIDSVTEIARLTPSLTFDKTTSVATSSNIVIRGVGTVGSNRAFEGAVGVFVDGVYRSRPGQIVQNWLDIDNVQVLRGPQGTLFGKNTSAGALLLSSTRPSLSGVAATYEVSYANYNDGQAKGAVNVPLSDNLAVRVAGLWTDKDGYIKNPLTGGNYNSTRTKALKLQALWEPSDDLTVRLIADWAELDGNCCYGQVFVAPGPTTPVLVGLVAPNPYPVSSDWRDYEMALTHNTYQHDEDRGVALHLDWKVGPGQLKYVGSYRRWNDDQLDKDGDLGPADILNLNETFQSKGYSHELTYTGDMTVLGVPADYLAGIYYAKEDLAATRDLLWGSDAYAYWRGRLGASINPALYEADPGLFKSELYSGTNKSFGLFTHWILSPTDRLKLVGGLRFSNEKKTGSFHDTFSRGVFAPAPPPYPITYVAGILPGPAYDDRESKSAVTGTFAVQYDLAPRIMAYASYSRGFKSGGVNLDANGAGGVVNNPAVMSVNGASAPPKDPTYRPETVDGLEAGLKADYLGGRARTNVAAFYNKIQDLQVAQFVGVQFVIFNASEAKIYGLEVENTFAVSSNLSFDLSGTWLPKANFGDDPALGTNSGRRLAKAPRVAVSGGLDYDQPISESLNATARASVKYSSSIYTNAANNLVSGDLTLVDLALGVRSPSAGWRFEVWCQNCTDRRYQTQTFTPTFQTQTNAFVGEPRRYGVTLRGEF